MMKRFENLDYKAIDAIGLIGTLATPVPTAYVITRALYNHMQFDLWAAIIAGAGVEIVGFFAANNMLLARGYNAERGKQAGNNLPTWGAVVLFIGYVAVAMILTAAIENNRLLILFPLLSMIAEFSLAFRQEYKRRIMADKAERERRDAAVEQFNQLEIEKERLRLEAEAREKEAGRAHRQELAKIKAASSVKADNASVKDDVTPYTDTKARREGIRNALQENETLTPTELANMFGVSRPTIYNDLDKINSNGHAHEQ